SASQIAAAFPARPRTWVYRHLPRQSSSAGWSFGLVSASSIARPGAWHLPLKDRSYLERAREILGAIDAVELRHPRVLPRGIEPTALCLDDEFSRSVGFCNLSCEIDAPGSDSIPFYDALVRLMRMMQEGRESSWKEVIKQELPGEQRDHQQRNKRHVKHPSLPQLSGRARREPEPNCLVAEKRPSFRMPPDTRPRLGGAFSCLSARWNRFATVRNQGARSENL